jgi:YidC/Oxa1 family membrane protein insertase
MFDFLAKLFGYVMKGCSWITGGNYVLAMLLFALAMQILLLPFGFKQQKNMVKQASIRPKEMAIRSKYKGRTDQVTMKKMQQEIMDLYQKEGYSQLAGCLPMLLQLIIIFPIYRVVIRPLEFLSGIGKDVCQSIYTALGLGDASAYAKDGIAQFNIISELRNNPEAFGKLSGDLQAAINDVGGIDGLPNMTLFGQDLGITPFSAFGQSYWWLIFIPIINLGLMYLSQFLTKKMSYQNPQAQEMNNSSMKIMMYVLPLMTMFITFSFAAGIGIYWIFRTLLSMLQQFIFYKLMPYPQFTEEDYKKAERDLKGNTKSKKDTSYVVNPGEYRSLHHIDD